jgi:isoleucyl-tRNA synthetase
MADDHSPTDSETAARRDYRETVFLPETPFPMRAGLPKLEPEILAKWEAADLYHSIRKARQAAGAPLYVLHDGPPYANGAIHIGHALNKTLKDFVVRSRFLLGYDVDYVPGWDCHGLPIEWKIEEKYRAKGQRKDDVPVAEFRAECRAYAAHWIEAQKAEFKRLGILGRWEAPYATMDFATEAKIVEEFHKFLMSGQLYRGSKPVMWSPVERTALADAEVEYHPHSSPTIWVKFPVVSDGPAKGAFIVIWTTTPWTIPANRAISFNPGIVYDEYEVTAVDTSGEFAPWANVGDRLIVANQLWASVASAAKITEFKLISARSPAGMVCSHPLAALDPGYGFDVPLLAGDHVTEDAGTGFVHTAPGHGADDYAVWLANGHRDIPDTVDPDGAYYPSVPLFGGLKVMETEGKKAGKFGPANAAVMDKLIEAGNLLARGRVEHSYPHSWRSKAPVIFRNTPQWFIRMDAPIEPSPPLRGSGQGVGGVGATQTDSHPSTADLGQPHPHPLTPSPQGGVGNTLRELALAAIDATWFKPESGRARLRGMVETRPDWLISRQRAWGTPIAMFVDKRTGEPLKDERVNARIVDAIKRGGADAWYASDPGDFLRPDHDPADYEQVTDILDVWFDSGSTYAFTIEDRADSHSPADLYIEGSDQSRGWFQSSLLESSGTRGRAPYRAVVTCGMTLNDQGEKMSKSLGNAIEPQTIIKQSGAEIIRLWVATVDYTEDQRIGPAVLQTVADSYRKLRNTLRYLLGALAGFEDADRVDYADMPPLERFILHRLFVLDGEVRRAYGTYDFNTVLRQVSEFCNADLSALYFDIRKDSLYCDRPGSIKRRAARTVMDACFARLTAWLSPLMPFTTEEAWTLRFPDAGPNALRVIPDTPAEWENENEAKRWAKVQELVGAVTERLEERRRDKEIGSALEAAPLVTVTPELATALDGLDLAEVARTSSAAVETTSEMSGGWLVDFARATGHKCERCWRILPEVKETTRLCLRCEDAVDQWDSDHAR